MEAQATPDFAKILEEKRRDLEAFLLSVRHSSTSTPGLEGLQEKSIADVARRRAEGDLHQVKIAQERFFEGSYGVCLRCEEPIGHSRLLARPESPVCTGCLERLS